MTKSNLVGGEDTVCRIQEKPSQELWEETLGRTETEPTRDHPMAFSPWLTQPFLYHQGPLAQGWHHTDHYSRKCLTDLLISNPTETSSQLRSLFLDYSNLCQDWKKKKNNLPRSTSHLTRWGWSLCFLFSGFLNRVSSLDCPQNPMYPGGRWLQSYCNSAFASQVLGL